MSNLLDNLFLEIKISLRSAVVSDLKAALALNMQVALCVINLEQNFVTDRLQKKRTGSQGFCTAGSNPSCFIVRSTMG